MKTTAALTGKTLGVSSENLEYYDVTFQGSGREINGDTFEKIKDAASLLGDAGITVFITGFHVNYNGK